MVKDMAYGPGWYATDLPPETTTDELLCELWQNNPSHLDKTEFYLRLSTESYRVVTPDESRPSLRFIPLVDQCRISGEDPDASISGQSTHPVYLVDAGQRADVNDRTPIVTQLFNPTESIKLIDAFIFGISGFSGMSPVMQENLCNYFGIAKST